MRTFASLREPAVLANLLSNPYRFKSWVTKYTGGNP
jgi:hypothetical protein